ncbi:MAG: peptide/nickel transport system ATP-binding protein [Nitrospirae bacterium]|nr:MAG: peptide/nickel transport system ATP-binding protein [Nitrospirota bacterium]
MSITATNDQHASPLLDVQDLSVRFSTSEAKFEVVSHVSFSIKKGEVFGLVGESGCGKSITALSILGIQPQQAVREGSIVFNGQDLLKLSEDEMRSVCGKNIGMVFQEPMTSLNPVLTVGYQVAEALLAHFSIPKKEALARAVELLRSVKMPSPELRVRDYPHQMSGGMRQRVMIAMAIACNPALLIADEPTTALDVTIQHQILKLMQEMRQDRGMALLLITHDLSIVSEHADRVAIMYAGRIMEHAPVRGLFAEPLHPYTIGLLQSLPRSRGAALKPIPGFVPPSDNLPPGCTFSDRCFACIDACGAAEPALREIRPDHFVRCIRAGGIAGEM